MNPSEGVKDGLLVQEVEGLLEVSLDQEEEGAAMGRRKEMVMDGEEV